MYKKPGLIFLLFLTTLSAGCAITAPHYSTNHGAVSALRAANLTPVKVGEISKDVNSKKNVEILLIRASSYSSPYGSFTSYLKEAMKDDLDHAGLLDEQSKLQVDGTLIRNTINAGGFSTANAEIEARLTIRREGSILYEGTKSIVHEWPSNFLGDVAIPRAAANYPLAVRKLLDAFYSDPEFISAIAKH